MEQRRGAFKHCPILRWFSYLTPRLIDSYALGDPTAVELIPSVKEAFGFYHADAPQVLKNPKPESSLMTAGDS